MCIVKKKFMHKKKRSQNLFAPGNTKYTRWGEEQIREFWIAWEIKWSKGLAQIDEKSYCDAVTNRLGEDKAKKVQTE